MPSKLRDSIGAEADLLISLPTPLGEHLDRSKELENEIRILKSSIDELHKKLSAAMRAAKASKELDSVKGELSRANKTIEESEKRIAKWAKKLEGSNAKIDELEAELEKEKEKVQPSNDELKKSQDYIKVLKDINFENENSIGKSYKKLAESTTRIQTLEKGLEDEKLKVAKLENEILALEGKVKDVSKMLVDAQVRFSVVFSLSCSIVDLSCATSLLITKSD